MKRVIPQPPAAFECARRFYGTLLGGRERQSRQSWVEFDVFGHQLLLQVQPHGLITMQRINLLFDLPTWRCVAQRLLAVSQPMVAPPRCRREGLSDEHWQMVLLDPAGHRIEITGRAVPADLFSSETPSLFDAVPPA